MQSMVEERAGARVLYDAGQLERAPHDWFEPDWLHRNDLVRGRAEGRGTTWFFEVDGTDMVLRHYHRGGAVARLLDDRYLGLGLERSRPWREWRLLATLFERGLAVPRPVAARVRRAGLFYRADLITRRIAGAESLAERMLEGRLCGADWRQVGSSLRGFHDQGLCHADLNARNILFGADRRVYLIDLDRGRLRAPGAWRQANLQRLHRSLHKIAGDRASPDFDRDAWGQLRVGYDTAA